MGFLTSRESPVTSFETTSLPARPSTSPRLAASISEQAQALWDRALDVCASFSEKRERELAASALLWTSSHLTVRSERRAFSTPSFPPGLEDLFERLGPTASSSLASALDRFGQSGLSFYSDQGLLCVKSSNGRWHIRADELLAAPWKDMVAAIGGFAASNPSLSWAEPSGELVLLPHGSYEAKVSFEPAPRRRFQGTAQEWRLLTSRMSEGQGSFLDLSRWEIAGRQAA